MTTEKFQKFILKLLDLAKRYSPFYYVMIMASLLFLQLDIFKENIPTGFIINGIIVIVIFTLSTNIVDKIIKKKNLDSRPYLFCPQCINAKMRTTGKWECEECHKMFSDPKKENV